MREQVRRDALKAEFVRRHLAVAEVARRCGVTPGHLSGILSGRRFLTERLARDISMSTGIPLALILPEREGVSA